MMSWYGNDWHISGSLWKETIVHWWIPITKRPVIRDLMYLMSVANRSCWSNIGVAMTFMWNYNNVTGQVRVLIIKPMQICHWNVTVMIDYHFQSGFGWKCFSILCTANYCLAYVKNRYLSTDARTIYQYVHKCIIVVSINMGPVDISSHILYIIDISWFNVTWHGTMYSILSAPEETWPRYMGSTWYHKNVEAETKWSLLCIQLFQCHVMHANCHTVIQISLKFVSEGSVGNLLALVYLTRPMLTQFIDV